MKIFRFITIWIVITLPFSESNAQIMIRGGVFDSTRLIPVQAVKVSSTGGAISYTDSTGHYSILVNPADSISFTFREKSTTKFPVKDIRNYTHFDISLQVRVQDKYQTLKEVVVIGKSYKQDSLENRERYRKIFGYEKPGLKVSENSALYGGTPGLDPNEIVNLFRFRRNKSLKKLQNRLLEEEARKFVDYRFNKTMVKRLTGLEGKELDSFMYYYRPSYDFAALSTEVQFLEYVLEASRYFKMGVLPPEENINK